MSLLSFNDILAKIDIDPKEVLLIRHPLSNKGFNACYKAEKVYEYTCHQKNDFGAKYKYWAVFIGDSGCYAYLYGLFEKKGSKPDIPKNRPAGLPESEKYKGTMSVYNLKKVKELEEYENRLIINWGKGTRSWYQRATNEKTIVAIQDAPRKKFVSYEDLILTYEELKDIVEKPLEYPEWKTILSSVYAIYLIVDRTDGKQYVGSAYGDEGLYGRWSYYVSSKHGGNKEMREVICDYPERYKNFQFSILQILPKSLSDGEVIKIESRYKDKLLSEKYGLNKN